MYKVYNLKPPARLFKEKCENYRHKSYLILFKFQNKRFVDSSIAFLRYDVTIKIVLCFNGNKLKQPEVKQETIEKELSGTLY